jgi:coronin-1B/1C/6
MSRFVRSSKYRHVFGEAKKKEHCYDNLKVTSNTWDSNIIKVNPLFFALCWQAQGGGAVAVVPLASAGKLKDIPLFTGHKAAVLDVDFSPFNDYLVASASEDATAKIWSIPEGGLESSRDDPVQVLSGHQRKVGSVDFNPVAENVIATTSTDLTVRIWDIKTGQEKISLDGHSETIQSLGWSWEGKLIATTCKDKKLRIYDARTKKVTDEVMAHNGSKSSRGIFLGESGKLFTTGFSKTSDRQYAVWDNKKLSEPLKTENLDTSSGVLMPFYDNDTNVLYLAGKGDGNIRYFEIVDEAPSIFYLTEYKSNTPQRGLGMLPKRAVDVSNNEIARAYKVHNTMVEPISFVVPRRGDAFQPDIYPDSRGVEGCNTSDAWFAGKDVEPKKVSMQTAYVPGVKVNLDFQTQKALEDDTPTIPKGEKELEKAYHKLTAQVKDLENKLAEREARIRKLEAQLKDSK